MVYLRACIMCAHSHTLHACVFSLTAGRHIIFLLLGSLKERYSGLMLGALELTLYALGWPK